MSSSTFPSATILGYPRIGRHRELKRAVESFWAGRIDAAELEATSRDLRHATRTRLAELGLNEPNAIPESFSSYDQVLDTAVAVGAIPTRFADVVGADGTVNQAGLFTIARGEGDRLPVEMTKWFDTNYHYSVPEIGPETRFALSSTALADQVREGIEDGYHTRPVVVGPVTFLLLAQPSPESPDDFDPLSRLDDLIPVYVDWLAQLRAAGAEWVQIDEPGLISDATGTPLERRRDAARTALTALSGASDRPSILVTTSYAPADDVIDVLASSGVEAVGVDLVSGDAQSDLDGADLTGITLLAGIVEGRNIWRGDLAGASDRLDALSTRVGSLSVGTSTSLLHVPYDVTLETQLDERLVSWLAFADQKVEQVVTLARGLREGREAIQDDLDAATAALEDRASAPGVRTPSVRERASSLTPSEYSRVDFVERAELQRAALELPILPTTTIGSFPQTGEIRRARSAFVRGELSDDDYRGFLREEITRVVRLQEDLGLDVIVHGEPERNDMVQYFAENLDGFAVTQHGWVQSYGSRATRPSILWGDVDRPAPITVEWSTFAQSLTDQPVKGMLTGPVTILAWSFVRDDQPLADTATQVALALRDEIADLEAAGISIIQVDEPALRELLPLRESEQQAYLDWSVNAFRLATAGAVPATQIHTHLCYSDFDVVIDAIKALDADVTSIESARSKMAVVNAIQSSGFSHGVGPGVYDIHSPRVPSERELSELIGIALDGVAAGQLWINPDCGLKTRGYDETEASLRALIAATKQAREQLASQ